MTETITYMHAKTPNFCVHKWQFWNHICRVPKSEVEAFVKCLQGLNTADSQHITEFDEERALSLHKPLGSTAVRGGLTAADTLKKISQQEIVKAESKPADEKVVEPVNKPNPLGTVKSNPLGTTTQ